MAAERDELRNKVNWALTLLHSVLGTCNRLLTASSAEKDKRVVGFSVNGSLPGQPHCDEVGHLIIDGHCERTRHGEMNLKDNTDQEKLVNSRVRVVGTPCLKCLKDLAGVPVREIRYTGSYNNQNFQPTPELIHEIFGPNFSLVHEHIDWAGLFQELFDKLSSPGGMFHSHGYRLKVTREPLASDSE